MKSIEPLYQSKDSKDYLLVKFRNSTKLFEKSDVHIVAYQHWQEENHIEIEELSSNEVAERLTGERTYEDPIKEFLRRMDKVKQKHRDFPNRKINR